MNLDSASPIVIVGAGRIGNSLYEALGSERPVSLLSARKLLARDPVAVRATRQEGVTLIFTHGQNVNVAGFRSKFEQILQSRVEPLRVAFDGGAVRRAVLISSTVAFATRTDLSLAAMQASYEAQFSSFSRGCICSVLRVGTLVGDGSQFSQGLEVLRKTILLKRLRSNTPLPVSVADMDLVIASVRAAVAAPEAVDWIVAYRESLDVNQALDGVFSGFRLRLPVSVLSMVWSLFGIRPEFLSVRPEMLPKNFWSPASSTASKSRVSNS